MEHHRKNPDEHRAYQRRYAQQERGMFSLWLAEEKWLTGCAECGERDPRCLVYHHRDPSTKRFQISQNAWSRTTASLFAEIEKCDLLCANCHQRGHYKRST
jgi:hypothetical protein